MAGSSTLTFVELAHETYSALPSGARAISVGCSAVGQTAATVFASRSRTATAAFAHRLTNARFAPGSTSTPYGNELSRAGRLPP